MGFSVGVIHIIQSLGRHDLQTGHLLRGILDDLDAEGKCPVRHKCWPEESKAGVLARLERIADEVAANGLAPIVHLEMHGVPDPNANEGHGVLECDQRWIGLETASGELIRWPDLVEPLTTINVRTCLNLVVVSQACGGFEIVQTMDPGSRAVVTGFVGPCRKLTAGEIRRANAAFYPTLFSTRDVRLAVVAMNATIPKGDAPFREMRAVDLFGRAFRGYLERHCTEERIADRVARAVAIARAENKDLDPAQFRKTITDNREIFDVFRAKYFLADLCPETLERFPLTLEECLPDPPQVSIKDAGEQLREELAKLTMLIDRLEPRIAPRTISPSDLQQRAWTFMLVCFSKLQLEHAYSIVSLAPSPSVGLLGRSMLEGTALLVYADSDPDTPAKKAQPEQRNTRAQRWMNFDAVSTWREVRRRMRIESKHDDEPGDKWERRRAGTQRQAEEAQKALDLVGNEFLTKTARAALAAGKQLPEDPYLRDWHNESITDIFETHRNQTALFLWENMSRAHHFQARTFAQAFVDSGDDLAINLRRVPTVLLAVAAAVNALEVIQLFLDEEAAAH